MRKARKEYNPWERYGAEALSDAAFDHEMEQEFFSELAAKLIAGSRGDNVTFSSNEFEMLLKLVRQHRPAVNNSQIALYSRRLEIDGWQTKAAVAETMKNFNVSRQTVFSARKRYLKPLD
jgi:hypothetical protein